MAVHGDTLALYGNLNRRLAGQEEMQLHLEARVQESDGAGMDTEEARYAARRQFGKPTSLAEAGAAA